MKYSHRELVKFAKKKLHCWGCLPIATEISFWSVTGEVADAIGWTARCSILFECKSSRADFLRDKEKLFRIMPDHGMGDFRFYLTNAGVIKSEDEIPSGWGCYEISDGKIKHKFGVIYANALPIPLNGNKSEEIGLMRSLFRRMAENKKGNGLVRNNTEKTEKTEVNHG